jgi:hypothetical protein
MLGKGQGSAVAFHHQHHVYQHVPMHFPCAHYHGGTLSLRPTRFQRVSISTNCGLTWITFIRHGQQMHVSFFAFKGKVITSCVNNFAVKQYHRAG